MRAYELFSYDRKQRFPGCCHCDFFVYLFFFQVNQYVINLKFKIQIPTASTIQCAWLSAALNREEIKSQE